MTIEKWIDTKLRQYADNPVSLLSELLSTTTALVAQHLDEPRSKAAEAALKNCAKCNRALLDKLWEIEQSVLENKYAPNQ